MNTDGKNMSLRVIDIVDGTIVDGPGLRTSIYLAGCRHACPGCHNPQSWDFMSGHSMSIDEIIEHVEDNGFNVTLSGGDPLYQIDAVVNLCRRLQSMGVGVWVYTGFTYEAVRADDSLSRILDVADVLVDAPFVLNLRDTSLRFRGSSNQRIIDLKKSKGNSIVEWSDQLINAQL